MADIIQDILRESQKIAVVGYSLAEEKTAHVIPHRLQEEGYEIYAVNPKGGTAFGKPIYKRLEEVPQDVDTVVFFRPGDTVSAFLPALLQRKNLRHVWLQLGIHNEEVKEAMETKGIQFVQDACMAVELTSRGGLKSIRKRSV